MTPIPIAKYLDRVSRVTNAKASAQVVPGVLAPTGRLTPQRNTDDEIKDAYERGLKEGYSSAISERAVAAEMEQVSKENLEIEQRQERRTVEFLALSEKVNAGLKEIENRTGNVVARILSPYLKHECAKAVAQSLFESLSKMFQSKCPALMMITGPDVELRQLKHHLRSLPIDVEYISNGEMDVVVRVDDTTIRTHLGQWISALDALER